MPRQVRGLVVVAGQAGVRVAGAQHLPKALERPPEEDPGARDPAVVALQDRQVVDGHRDVGVIPAEERLQDCERARVEGPGACQTPALLFEGRQAGQAEPELETARAQLATEDGKRPLVKGGRFRETAPPFHDGGQRGDIGSHRGVLGAERRDPQGHRTARVGLRLGVAAARVLAAAEIVLERGPRLAVAAGQQRQRPPVVGQRFDVATLGLAQNAQVVEQAADEGVAGRQAASGLGQSLVVASSGSGERSPRALEAAERDPRLQGQTHQIQVVARLLQDRQSATVAEGRLARTIAGFQDHPQLDQRVGDVGMTAPLAGLIAVERAAASPFGEGKAPGDAQRDRALVGRDGDAEVTGGGGPVGIVGDGCLRAGIVACEPQMSPPSPSSPSSQAPEPEPSSTPRRFFAPEVIQTSAMDCGPAALKCLLEGFGVRVSYGRLREACQTAVDGTSIDTLETLAVSLGLHAEQVMMPVDHLLLEEADALPAIVVVRMPSGLTHFVVVWRLHGGFVQVMDPARGRRWVRRAAFLRDVYLHNLAVPADAFLEWSGSEGFTRPLGRRLRALGIDDGEALVGRARQDPDWSAMAALDGAVRTVTALVASGALARGAEARRLVEALAPPRQPGDRIPPPGSPSIYAAATAAPPGEDGAARVSFRGAVLLRVTGARPLDDERRAALPVELRAAVDEPRVRVGAELWRLLEHDGLLRWSALGAGVALTALGAVTESVLFRTLIDFASGRTGGLVARMAGRLSGRSAFGGGRLFAAIVLLLIALLAVELPLAGGLRGAGRRLEERLRRLFLHKIPRLPDRYFQSRPVSDMAERAHLLHRLRALPTLGADLARTALEIVVIAVALAWLDPRGAGLVFCLAAAMLLIPFVAEPAVAERDLRMRNHAGALGRFYLDGLLGLVAARTHGAGPALTREHRDRLREWVRAARTALGAALAAEAAQTLIGFGLAIWLLIDFWARGPGAGASAGTNVGADPGTALLVVYWALSLPALGQELALFVQQIPAQRNLTLRLIEPLGAPEEGPSETGHDAATRAPAEGAAGIELDDVRVVAGGHQILEIGALTIAPGEHLAIVGASGAGKSSLVGLLLGWHHPATGSVCVDGLGLDGAGLEALRRRTVWVDPSVYLWNRSLLENLTFGSPRAAATPEMVPGSESPGLPAVPGGAAVDPAVDETVGEADLREVVRRLPLGLGTPLGEAGGLVSGGEGQRVRFGRGLLRRAPRLVILDEPFRGLAREQRGLLLSRARRRWSSATVICVTHDIEETASFPRVLVVADGRVAEDGAPSALLARPGSRYAALAEAERRVMAASWSGDVWRRVRLQEGQLDDGRRA